MIGSKIMSLISNGSARNLVEDDKAIPTTAKTAFRRISTLWNSAGEPRGMLSRIANQ